jgi:hypothetical protein
VPEPAPDTIPEEIWQPIEAGQFFFACARRRRLVAYMRAGDLDAIEAAIAALPLDLPPRLLCIERNREIRRLDRDLRNAHPDRNIASSRRAMSRLLAAAGRRAVGGGETKLSLIPEFAWLDGAEAADLVERVREIIEFAPERQHSGTRWPSRAQLVRIIGGD